MVFEEGERAENSLRQIVASHSSLGRQAILADTQVLPSPLNLSQCVYLSPFFSFPFLSFPSFSVIFHPATYLFQQQQQLRQIFEEW